MTSNINDKYEKRIKELEKQAVSYRNCLWSLKNTIAMIRDDMTGHVTYLNDQVLYAERILSTFEKD
jgi:hypothetical protein